MALQTYDMELISSSISPRDYDFFILAPNIEKRSRAVSLWMQNADNCKNYVLANYANFHTNLSFEQEDIFFSDFCKCPKVVFDVNDDAELFTHLSLLDIRNTSRVGVDISGFSVPAVYGLMLYLKDQCHLSSLDVYYTEPKNYVYEEGYYDSYHPSNKHRACSPIPGYINCGRDEREVLTIFLGFDGGLADQVYGSLGEEAKPMIRTIAVNGFPSYTAKLKDVSLYNNETFIDKIAKTDRMTTTANNPFDTFNVLCRILKENKDVLLNICTIGSKPMALGACLFALEHLQDVKISYPFYTKTRFDILEQAGKMWRYGITF